MNAPFVMPGDATGSTRLDRPVRYIRSHAALRGLAALMVVAYHLQFGAPHSLAIETATPFFARGYLLVDLFFILSGFVISLTSDADQRRPFSRGETRDFYVARLARIYPLHLFCLCAIVVGTLGLGFLRQWHHAGTATLRIDGGDAASFVAELLLVQAWIPGAPHWNVPSWSISAELFAYAVFPLILLLRSRLPRVSMALLLMLPALFYLSIAAGDGSLDIVAGLAPLRCLSGFAVGVVLYDLRRSVTRWPDGVIAVGQVTAVAAIVAVLATPCPDPLVIPFFALLVIATWQDRGPLAALLLHRALIRSGELSYSIYLNHVCVITLLFPIWYALATRIGLDADAARIGYIVICFVGVLAVSRWTHAQIEQKSRRYLRRLLSRPARP